MLVSSHHKWFCECMIIRDEPKVDQSRHEKFSPQDAPRDKLPFVNFLWTGLTGWLFVWQVRESSSGFVFVSLPSLFLLVQCIAAVAGDAHQYKLSPVEKKIFFFLLRFYNQLRAGSRDPSVVNSSPRLTPRVLPNPRTIEYLIETSLPIMRIAKSLFNSFNFVPNKKTTKIKYNENQQWRMFLFFLSLFNSVEKEAYDVPLQHCNFVTFSVC